tara:strand:+ start:38 stop:2050 length:2013 start_codon:yes stop_codon:yes gene_type:complete
MAEITDTMTLGEALDFSIERATSLEDKNAAKNLTTFKNNIASGKLGENVTLDSDFSSTFKSPEFIKQVSDKGTTKSNYYTSGQALEKYVNQGNIDLGRPETNVFGATGTAKRSGLSKGQTRGALNMRGTIPMAEIDKIYAQGFDAMKADKTISEATKDFLLYHRYTIQRVDTILTDTEDYKSLRLSDVTIFEENGVTSVSVAGETRGKKTRNPVTYRGAFAEFLKDVYDKAKSASPKMPNAEIKLFNTSSTKASAVFKKYMTPLFVDKFESFLPIKNGKVETGFTTIVRSATIQALESDLKLGGELGDQFMGHKDTTTKGKSYKANSPESKSIGNITENLLKNSATNLQTGTVNSLFTQYGINSPSLDMNTSGKSFPAHEEVFSFGDADLTKENVSRPPTDQELELQSKKTLTNIKLEEVTQEELEIKRLGKQKEKLGLQKQVALLTNDETIKKIQNQETEKKVKAQIKLENELLGKQDAWKQISAEGIETLKAQGLWDDIVAGAKKLKGPAKMAVGPVIAAALYPGESEAAEKRYDEADPNSIRGFIKKGGDTVQNVAETGEALVTSVAKGFDPGVELGLDLANIASKDTLESVQNYRNTDVRKGKRQLDVPSYKEKVDARLLQKQNASSMGLETSEKDMSEVQPMGYAMEQDQSELLRKKVPEAQGFI